MDVLVSDTSVVIDLERAGLIEHVFALPYRFVVPDALYEQEMKAFGGLRLVELGLQVRVLLDGLHYDDGVERSIWLLLIRDRLEIIRRLLADDGSLWITRYRGALPDGYFATKQPDFVAEADREICMLEPKAANEMKDPMVLAKKEAAVKWCRNASDPAVAHGSKPWRYALIPHSSIADNMTLKGLVQQCGT